MKVTRILITGGSGFVGPHARAACSREFPEAEIINGNVNVTDQDAVYAMICAARPDAVIHLAGLSSVPRARIEPDRAFAVNLNGTINLARALIDIIPSSVLIHAGSAECYGASFRLGTPLDEDAPLWPLNTYAASPSYSPHVRDSLAGMA